MILPLAVEIHIGGRTQGGFFTKVEEVRLTIGQAQHHEAAAAQVACVGVDDRQREAGGDRGIHRISPRLQHLQARVTGVVMNADHHGVLRLGRRNIRQRAGLAMCERGHEWKERTQTGKQVRAWPSSLRSIIDSVL